MNKMFLTRVKHKKETYRVETGTGDSGGIKIRCLSMCGWVEKSQITPRFNCDDEQEGK